MAAADRISELPEPILHRILSSLSHKQSIQTSALSRTWRHVGPTRPKIELRGSCFKKSGRPSFLSVLGKTLQRYNHRNLYVDEFILEMPSESESESESELQSESESQSESEWESESESESDDQLVDLDLEKILSSKGLKRLSLSKVHIKAETLEKIMRSCPLIEYLLVSDCVGLTTIPITIFQAESLTELHLIECRLIVPTTTQLLLIKPLKTLSLERVYITEETLAKIMCGCSLIQRLLLTNCAGLRNIQLINNNNNNNNLKHFSVSFYKVKTQSLAIHSPAIETISIVKCPNWYGHDNYSFPRLKSLCLDNVKLSAELFESFSSSNFPSLEELQLKYCYGLEEIQLTACSIKRLILITDSVKPIKATIYSPKIHYFKFFGFYPPQLIFTSETSGGEWKSDIEVWSRSFQSEDKDLNLLWFIHLSKLLNSLCESQISLVVDYYPLKNLKVKDTNDAGFCNPVPLEYVRIRQSCEYSSFPDLLNGLFLICRPRCIDMSLHTINPVTDLKQEKDKFAELITLKTIQNEGEMSRGYLWEQDLEEIIMQVWDQNSQGWHTVGVEGTCFPELKASYPMIRFSVKWRD